MATPAYALDHLAHAEGSHERLSFMVQREGWRWTMMKIESNEPQDPELVSWVSDSQWCYFAGDPLVIEASSPNNSIDNHGLTSLLDADWLVHMVGIETSGPFTVPSEKADVDSMIDAKPRMRDLSLIHPKADRYEGHYDSSLQVITAWSGFVDGHQVRQLSLGNLTGLD